MPDTPRRRRPRRWVALAALAIVGLAATLALLRARSPAPQPPPIPSPNGYDVLLRAARMVGPPPNEGEINGAKPEDLRSWVAANREALDLADRGLDLPSGVPLDFTQADPAAAIADLGPIRALGRLMLADVLIARDDGRVGDAADRALDAIRLARRSSHNGLLIHRLTGNAMEQGVGLEGLRRIRDDLDEGQCRELARTLLELDDSAPDAEETLALEAAWSRATMPRGVRVARAVIPGVRSRLRSLAKPAEDAFRGNLLIASASRRLLAVDLAIQAYQLLHDGAPPDRLDRLVPEFLPDVPDDPFTGRPLVYRPAGDGESYRLYSVGPEGRDDGGVPYPPRADWSKTPGDLLVDPRPLGAAPGSAQGDAPGPARTDS